MTRFVTFLKSYVWRYRLWYLGGFLSLCLTNFVMTVIPRKIECAIDLIQLSGTERSELQGIIWSILGLAGVLLLIRTVSRILLFYPGRFVEFDLRNNLYTHFMRMPSAFYREFSKGDLMSRSINDIQSLRLMVGFGFLHVMNTILAFGLVTWQMSRLNGGLTLLALLPLPCFLLLSRGLVRGLHQGVIRNQKKLGSVTNFVVEAFGGIAVVKSFGAEETLTERFHEENKSYREHNLHVARLRSMLFPMLHIMGPTGHFLVFVFGGAMVIRGDLTLGAFTAFGLYVAQLAWPSAAAGWIISIFQRGLASLKRLDQILAWQQLSISPSETSNVPETTPPDIQLTNLTFSYTSESESVLNDLNLTIPSGSLLGVFGPTGSGKSTLARLLVHLEKVPKNCIFIDDQPLEQIPLDLWWQKVAWVPQSTYLFSETLQNNVAYWPDNLSEAERLQHSEKALREAGLERDVALFSKGVRTLVGEKGIYLSGGQKSRTALARALYRPASLLVLDDVLAAVDHETEARLIESLTRLRGKQTVILISHRVSALTHCDQIVVLEHGSITAKGSHECLSSQAGIYRDTWLYQKMDEGW